MESIVRDALEKRSKKDTETPKTKTRSSRDQELESLLGKVRTVIRVVGTGGAGNNTLTRLNEVGVRGVESVAVNTDAQDLLATTASQKILIGREITGGLGAGSDPRIGEEAARENQEAIRAALEGSDMVFVTCGLGGGTGTGSAPVIAEIARSCQALTIAVVTLPFTEEGVVRWENARRGLERLKKNADTVIVIQNDRLLDIVPDLPLNAAFKVADEILVNAVRGITELVTEKGLVNLDFADVRTVMRRGGTAMIGLGESSGEDRAKEAVEKALRNPLLDVDITGAQSALVNVTGGSDLTLKEARQVMHAVAERLDPNAHIIWGARIDESLGKAIRVMVIATGLKVQGRSPEEVEQALKEVELTAVADFDVREPLLKEEPEAEEEAQEEKSGAARVFDEIFVEESSADIELLRQATARLDVGVNEASVLKSIRNACQSLQGAAQLFGETEIDALCAVTIQTVDAALQGDFSFSHSLVRLFQEIPEAAAAIAKGEPGAIQSARLLTRKMEGFLEIIRETDTGGNGNGNGHGQTEGSETPEGEVEEPEQIPEPPPEYESEEDAVKYIKQLFEQDAARKSEGS